MKSISYFLAAAVLFLGAAGMADAQEKKQANEQSISKVYELEENEVYGVDKLYKGDFFVGIGGGAAVYFGEHDRQMAFNHRLSPAMDVYAGKWLLPWLGIRVAYSGGRAFGLTNADTDKVFSTGNQYPKQVGSKGIFWQEFDYFGVRADAMFNVTSIIGGNNPDRFYDISPYVGFGVHKVYNTPLKETCVGVALGLFNTFRVSKSIDIVLDVHGTAVPEKFEHETGTRPGVKPNGIYSFDGILTAALGVAYNF